MPEMSTGKIGPDFPKDPNPGAPRILFIGQAESSHTQSWIDLLPRDSFNVRLFAMPSGAPPASWPVPTYLSNLSAALSTDLDPANRRALFQPIKVPRLHEKLLARPLPACSMGQRQFMTSVMQEWKNTRWRAEGYQNLLDPQWRQWFSGLGAAQVRPPLNGGSLPDDGAWLAQIIRNWQPHIIHTLGLEAGGFYYQPIREKYGLEKIGVWVQQLRGGSDLALNRLDQGRAAILKKILAQPDWIITDNSRNPDYLAQLGVGPERLAPINPVPGTGGMEVDRLASLATEPPAKRRLILWPKAYESPWSKALPVLEALKLSWDRIQPCEIHLLAADQETRLWASALPTEIRAVCTLHERLPRNEALKLAARARVMLIPSLVDGIPNTMYEAMALGALPIVSPLDTISTLVADEVNVLMARNLYPDEIAQALGRAMSDDALVERLAAVNRELVSRVAQRSDIAARVAAFYQGLAG